MTDVPSANCDTDRAAVDIYTLSGCVHCTRARALLHRRRIAFTEISGDTDPRFRQQLHALTGRSTVPQITIDGEPIGGASDIARLDRCGVLVPLVDGERFPYAIVRRRIRLSSLLKGLTGRRAVWGYRVDIVARDGTALERIHTTSVGEAVQLACARNATRDAPSP